MEQFDTVISNGTVITAADTFRCDVGIREGKIIALADRLNGAKQVLDATGKLVMPGGVDAHCHLDQPMNDGSKMADDFVSGTRSAAAGGTTTVIPFAFQFKGQSIRAAVKDYHKRADGKALVDYAFHLIVTDPTAQTVGQDLPALIREGYTSFKIYMTYDQLKLTDRQIIDVLAVAKRERAIVMIHAENADIIEWLNEGLLAAGKTAPRYHAESRPVLVEREATHRAISIAEIMDVPIMIVHVSGREAAEQIRGAQARGLKIYGETCPQYLFLSAEVLDREGFEGAKCVCSPPPRDPSNQAAIWNALSLGVFQVFSSDHAPFRYADERGKRNAGANAPFTKIPNGIPGIETRLPLLFSGGVGENRISAQQFVALTATNPARLYGLYPRKGTIAVGTDADIAIWDPNCEIIITNERLHHNVDYTPYEGMKVRGWPTITLSRGKAVWRDGKIIDQAGHGQFLRCDPPAL